jgi:hypothetical protein
VRFPELHFSFLEGGAVWAPNLSADLLGHYEKRNRVAVEAYNPKRLDRALVSTLLEEHGHGDVRSRLDPTVVAAELAERVFDLSGGADRLVVRGRGIEWVGERRGGPAPSGPMQPRSFPVSSYWPQASKGSCA